MSRKTVRLRQENGLCPSCGGKMDRVGYYCSKCLKKLNEYNKKYYEIVYRIRKENKICVKCGKEFCEHGVFCEKCKEKIKKETSEERRWLKEHGICPKCRKNSILGDEKECLECKSKFAEKASEYRKKDKDRYNEKQRIMHKRIYEKRKESGLCPICGKRKPDNRYVSCALCRSKNRERNRTINWIPNRIESGICVRCNNPVEKGYKVCEEHHRKLIEISRSDNAKKERERLKEQGILY